MARALLIIDFQSDFTPPDGALAVPRGDEIAGRLNELAADPAFDIVIATRDWHPRDHSSFVSEGGAWPPHCVQGTPGAELDPALDRSHVDAIVDAGVRRDADGYSSFEEPELDRLLRDNDVTDVTVVGLATDYCVLHTARDALARGYRVSVDRSGIRAIDAQPGDGDAALRELESLGARVV